MKTNLSIAIASILTLNTSVVLPAASFAVTADVGGVPIVSGATLENFNGASPSILTLSGNAYFFQAALGQVVDVAPPNLATATATLFNEPTLNGYDASQYVGVQIGGSATLHFSTPQSYLGLVWGSVDAGNVLSFYDSADNLLGTVNGEDVPGDPIHLGSGFTPAGSPYVNIISTTPFSKIVATSSNNSFEFDDVAYAQVPEPASGALLVFGLLSGVLFRSSQQHFRKDLEKQSFTGSDALPHHATAGRD